MASRSASLRTKIVALLVSLAALWAFAAWVTLRDGFNVLGVQTLDAQVAQPRESLPPKPQRERRLSVAYLGRRDPGMVQQLQAQHERSEKESAAFAEASRNWRARFASSDELITRIDAVITRLDGLGQMREAVDAGTVAGLARRRRTPGSSMGSSGSTGPWVSSTTRGSPRSTVTLAQLFRVRELMSQEDALFAGVAAAGRSATRRQPSLRAWWARSGSSSPRHWPNCPRPTASGTSR